MQNVMNSLHNYEQKMFRFLKEIYFSKYKNNRKKKKSNKRMNEYKSFNRKTIKKKEIIRIKQSRLQ